MSADLQWMIIRNNSSFLIKGSKTTFSKEANNLTSKNSFRYNGLVNRKTVGVEAAADGKGVSMVLKNSTGQRKPRKQFTRTDLKRGHKRSLNTIKKVLANGKYRKDLTRVAVRRAGLLLNSQKPVVPKKTMRKKKE